MAHICHAGCTKLVVMSNGYIIPCEAFKGLYEELPELVLGHVSEPDALRAALERARAIVAHLLPGRCACCGGLGSPLEYLS